MNMSKNRKCERTPFRRALGCLCLLLVMLALGACEVVTNEETGMATKRIQAYLAAIEAGQFHKAAALYPADKAPDWEAFLKGVEGRLGRLRSYELDGPETNIVFSGKFYIFSLDGEYERGTTEEVITLFQGLKEPLPHLDYHKITKERHGKPEPVPEMTTGSAPPAR